MVHRRALADADDPEAERDRLAAEYAEDHLSAAVAAQQGSSTRSSSRATRAAAWRGRSRGCPTPACSATARATSRYDDVRRDWVTASPRASSPAGRAGPTRWRRRSVPACATRTSPGWARRAPTWSATSCRGRSSSTRPDHADLRRQRRARVGPPGPGRVRRAARAHVRPAAGRGAGRPPAHGDLPGHLALPRPATALARARAERDAALQRRRPGGRPRVTGWRCSSTSTTRRQTTATPTPKTASTPRRRGIVAPRRPSCGRCAAASG